MYAQILSIKFLIEAFKYQKKLERLFQTFAVLVAKFWNKNDCKLDENLRNFSFYQK